MYNYPNNPENRQFLVPFLLGGIGGAALNSVTRPRPVYVNGPAYYPRPNYGYNYYGGYNYNPYPYPYYR